MVASDAMPRLVYFPIFSRFVKLPKCSLVFLKLPDDGGSHVFTTILHGNRLNTKTERSVYDMCCFRMCELNFFVFMSF